MYLALIYQTLLFSVCKNHFSNLCIIVIFFQLINRKRTNFIFIYFYIEMKFCQSYVSMLHPIITLDELRAKKESKYNKKRRKRENKDEAITLYIRHLTSASMK